MKIVIIEDETLAVKKLKSLLFEIDTSIEVVAELDSIESSVDWLNTNPSPDIILMDIELLDGQSFEIFERSSIACPVIFTTSYDEYAIQAFTVNSVAYLLKPMSKSDLEHALDKFKQLKSYYSTSAPGFSISHLVEELQSRMQPKNYRKRFLTKYANKLTTIETPQVSYFFTEERVNFMRTFDERKIMIDYTLEEIEHMLDPTDFFRINRSYIISLKSIQKMEDYFGQRILLQVKPTAFEHIIVSREKVSAFKTWLGK